MVGSIARTGGSSTGPAHCATQISSPRRVQQNFFAWYSDSKAVSPPIGATVQRVVAYDRARPFALTYTDRSRGLDPDLSRYMTLYISTDGSVSAMRIGSTWLNESSRVRKVRASVGAEIADVHAVGSLLGSVPHFNRNLVGVQTEPTNLDPQIAAEMPVSEMEFHHLRHWRRSCRRSKCWVTAMVTA